MPLKREMGWREIEKKMDFSAKRKDVSYTILTIFSILGLSD